jgi:hypothetical protein
LEAGHSFRQTVLVYRIFFSKVQAPHACGMLRPRGLNFVNLADINGGFTDYASHGHISNALDFLPFAHGVVEVGLDHLSASSGPFVLG